MKLGLKLQFFSSKSRFSGRIQSSTGGIWAKGNVTVEKSATPVNLAPLLPGTRTDATGKAVNNIILLSLPDEEYNLLRFHLEPAELPQYDILHEPGEKIDFAYFLNEGMTYLVALSSDGRDLEVGSAGKEGMVGSRPTATMVAPERLSTRCRSNGRYCSL